MVVATPHSLLAAELASAESWISPLVPKVESRAGGLLPMVVSLATTSLDAGNLLAEAEYATVIGSRMELLTCARKMLVSAVRLWSLRLSCTTAGEKCSGC